MSPVMVKGLKGQYHADKNKLKRQTCPWDAGFDLYPDRSDPQVSLYPVNNLIKVGTSLNLHFTPGTYGHICERSSSNAKLAGARVRDGYIDSGYTGEILVVVICPPHQTEIVLEAIKVCQQQEIAIAQMIVCPVMLPLFCEWVDQNVQGGRGANGFGSTDLFVKG